MRVAGGMRPAMIRVSVVVHRRRCGKANCRCAEGEALHESTVLNYSEGGRSRMLMLAPEEVARVRAATEVYRRAKAAVEDQGSAGLAELVARLGSHRKGRP